MRDRGKFVSTATVLERFLARAGDRGDACWEWNGHCDRAGYGRMLVERKSKTTHRLAWGLFKGEIPEGLCVCHRCDNRKCVNPDHLFLGTNDDNMKDMKEKGRAGKNQGERHPSAKLTAEQVLEIHERGTSETNASLAEEFGVSSTAIFNIVHGLRWKSVLAEKESK